MLGLFRKKSSPEQQAEGLCEALAPHPDVLVGAVAQAGGYCSRPYEAGLFVAIAALVALERQGPAASRAMRESFAALWIVRLVDGQHGSTLLSDTDMNELLFERYRAYAQLIGDTEPSRLQLTRELFTNCSPGVALAHPGCFPAPAALVARLMSEISLQASAIARR